MTSKNEIKENARTRYDAKKPTVSFRISKEERDRIDALRKDYCLSFRDIILTGAGMIEKDKAKEKKRRAEEKKRLEEAVKTARIGALKNVQIGVCRRCGKPLYWDLTKEKDCGILSNHLWSLDYTHPECVNRPQLYKDGKTRPKKP